MHRGLCDAADASSPPSVAYSVIPAVGVVWAGRVWHWCSLERSLCLLQAVLQCFVGNEWTAGVVRSRLGLDAPCSGALQANCWHMCSSAAFCVAARVLPRPASAAMFFQ